MRIEIKTVGVVVRGEKFHEIKHVDALGEKDLPAEYMRHTPHVELRLNARRLYIETLKDGSWGDIKEGEIIPEKRFSFLLKAINAAGKRLSEINARLRKENEGWGGSKHTHII